MAKEKKRKGKARKGAQSDRHTEVQLAPTIDFLHQNLSKALCDEVFHDLRTTERERKWSLFALARFWLAVILVAPPSLSQLLEQTRRYDPRGFLPEIAASAESFFQKCKHLSDVFFAALYFRFVQLIFNKAPQSYSSELAYLQKKFAHVVAIDGSRLDKVAHRLKILQREKAAILPGCLLAVYDIFRGIATRLYFEADAAAAEFTRGIMAVESLASNTLVLGDRLYCSVALFGTLEANGCFGVLRRNKSVSIKKVRRVSRQRLEIGLLEDWIVQAGRKGSEIELRLITLKLNGKTYEALTNVLDPKRLSAEDVAKLYPYRWKIERLFHDLKVVLNLKQLYTANPNAVAMQVYAAAMVHVAFRVAQADIATKYDLPPEELSAQKLFPLLALTSIKLLEGEYWFERTQKINPSVKLRKPSFRDVPGTVVSLRHIRRQQRSGPRRKREYHKDRATWKSITKVDGAEELT